MRQTIVLPIVLLISVAMIAGCVGQSGGGGTIFGSDVIKTTRTTMSAGISDPVAITNVRTLPESTTLPSNTVRLLMNIMSQHTDPSKPIKFIYIDLFDAHVMIDPNTNQPCNEISGSCKPVRETCALGGQGCVLQVGQVIPIEYVFKAPSAAEIANIRTTATMNWALKYDYDTSTNYDILVVGLDEILRLQQEGQSLTVPVQNTQGTGPVKIAMSSEPAFTQPGEDIYLTVKLQDTGSGFVENKTIPADKLTITIPSGLTVATELLSGFSCSGQVCKNNRNIEFFRKETSPYLFILRSSAMSTPYRTFTVTASIAYTYELRGSTSIDIVPQQYG